MLNLFILDAPAEEVASETAVIESRTSGKSKKRAPWKGKTEFSHQWLLKNLKGHPGTVLLVDFSSNGKFMAATCDGKSQILDVFPLIQGTLSILHAYECLGPIKSSTIALFDFSKKITD